MKQAPVNKNITISDAAIAAHYTVLDGIGAIDGKPANGFHRPAYSDAESAAFDYIAQAARAAGLRSRRDAVGNLIIETPGQFSRWVETGSHLDTVDGGGNYDGVAGVVAGLESVIAAYKHDRAAANHSKQPDCGLRLRVWRGEESAAFGTASLGAWAAFGQLNPETLERSHDGQSLAQAMRAQGAEPDWIAMRKAVMSPAEQDSIAAHIELHIEQGSVLESNGCDIGMVTGIRGSIRNWVHVAGTFDHSGATPMAAASRQDANLAMAQMLVALNAQLQIFNADMASESAELMQTFGVINSHQEHSRQCPQVHGQAVSKVSGFSYFSHEIRSCDAGQSQVFYEQSVALMHQLADQFGVRVSLEPISVSEGIAQLDGQIQQLVAEACTQRALRAMSLPSGAWHDVAVLAQQQRPSGAIATGMIFIPCRAGISHSSQEYSSCEQIAAGASVLVDVMMQLRHQYGY